MPCGYVRFKTNHHTGLRCRRPGTRVSAYIQEEGRQPCQTQTGQQRILYKGRWHWITRWLGLD